MEFRSRHTGNAYFSLLHKSEKTHTYSYSPNAVEPLPGLIACVIISLLYQSVRLVESQ